MGVGSFKDLKVYRLAYDLAMEIFHLSQAFPKEETYALTDQIRRSSRSVCANIAEAYRRRNYVKHFASKITDSDSEASETLVWIDFARDSGYISDEVRDSWVERYEEVGKMLGGMARQPERFLPPGARISEELTGYEVEDK